MIQHEVFWKTTSPKNEYFCKSWKIRIREKIDNRFGEDRVRAFIIIILLVHSILTFPKIHFICRIWFSLDSMNINNDLPPQYVPGWFTVYAPNERTPSVAICGIHKIRCRPIDWNIFARHFFFPRGECIFGSLKFVINLRRINIIVNWQVHHTFGSNTYRRNVQL